LFWEHASTIAFIAVSSAMLSWVALLNGAPLVFPDTASYATTVALGEIPGMFSVFYGIFILPLHQGITLWPVVLAQGAVVAHLLYLVVRCVTGGYAAKTETLLMVAALSLLSGLPWFTGQIMPDVFSGVVILGFFLLAFCTDQLGRRELLYVSALTTAGIVTHLSHVPVALGLIALCGALWPMFAPRRIAIGRRTALLLIPFLLGVYSLLAVNWINSRQLVFARNSNVFLLAKLIEEGPAYDYLAQACPEARYSLCPYVDELKGQSQDGLKWSGGSPFYKVGGFDVLEPEARSIVWATLRAYPLRVLHGAMSNAGRQLLHFDIGEGLSPDSLRLVNLYIGKVFGADVEQSLLRSKQADGRLPLAEFRSLHRVGLLLGLALVVWSLTAAGQKLPGRLLALYVFVGAGILCNVIVTSALSGPFDRYLARVIWLVCFAGLVGLSHMARRHRGAVGVPLFQSIRPGNGKNGLISDRRERPPPATRSKNRRPRPAWSTRPGLASRARRNASMPCARAASETAAPSRTDAATASLPKVARGTARPSRRSRRRSCRQNPAPCRRDE